jgi:hypothetical protein
MLLAKFIFKHTGDAAQPPEAPQPPILGGQDSKSPRIGGFRGPPTAGTMLQNISPAASILGDFERMLTLDWGLGGLKNPNLIANVSKC